MFDRKENQKPTCWDNGAPLCPPPRALPTPWENIHHGVDMLASHTGYTNPNDANVSSFRKQWPNTLPSLQHLCLLTKVDTFVCGSCCLAQEPHVTVNLFSDGTIPNRVAAGLIHAQSGPENSSASLEPSDPSFYCGLISPLLINWRKGLIHLYLQTLSCKGVQILNKQRSWPQNKNQALQPILFLIHIERFYWAVFK